MIWRGREMVEVVGKATPIAEKTWWIERES